MKTLVYNSCRNPYIMLVAVLSILQLFGVGCYAEKPATEDDASVPSSPLVGTWYLTGSSWIDCDCKGEDCCETTSYPGTYGDCYYDPFGFINFNNLPNSHFAGFMRVIVFCNPELLDPQPPIQNLVGTYWYNAPDRVTLYHASGGQQQFRVTFAKDTMTLQTLTGLHSVRHTFRRMTEGEECPRRIDFMGPCYSQERCQGEPLLSCIGKWSCNNALETYGISGSWLWNRWYTCGPAGVSEDQ